MMMMMMMVVLMVLIVITKKPMKLRKPMRVCSFSSLHSSFFALFVSWAGTMRASQCAAGDLDDEDQKDPIRTPTKADRLWFDYDEHKNNEDIKPSKTVKKKLDKCTVFSFSCWYSKPICFCMQCSLRNCSQIQRFQAMEAK